MPSIRPKALHLVILEVSFILDIPELQTMCPKPLLDTSPPEPFVRLSVFLLEPSVPIDDVILEISLVHISIGMDLFTLSHFFVVFPGTYVLLTIGPNLDADALTFVVFELAFEKDTS